MRSNLEKAKQALQGQYNTYQTYQPTISIQRQRMNEISEMIKTERKNKGWSQRQLAKASGYSQGTITRAENHMWISLYCMMSIFEALDKKISLINK